MIALANGGQRAAALQLFVDVRNRLVEELGVELDTELRAAHLQILRRHVPEE